MKKINKSISKKYPPVRIFFDDLGAIEELLSNRDEYKIEYKSLEFSNIEELKKGYENESITNLQFYSSNPYVHIAFNKLWTELYVGSDNTDGAGLFYKLDKLISSTVLKPSFLYSLHTIFFISLAVIILHFLLKNTVNIIISFLSYPLLVWGVWVSYINLYKHSQIILSKRHVIKGFLKRNGDQIIVNLFTGTIGTALGVLGTIIAYRMGYLK